MPRLRFLNSASSTPPRDIIINHQVDVCGASATEADAQGETLLHKAVGTPRKGLPGSKDGHASGGLNARLATVLLDAGADPNSATTSGPQQGSTPLHIAAVVDLGAARCLLDRGADVNATNAAGLTAEAFARSADFADPLAQAAAIDFLVDAARKASSGEGRH
jgi:ankyrin repeat protein